MGEAAIRGNNKKMRDKKMKIRIGASITVVICRFSFGEPGAVRPRISSANRSGPYGTRLTKLAQSLMRQS